MGVAAGTTFKSYKGIYWVAEIHNNQGGGGGFFFRTSAEGVQLQYHGHSDNIEPGIRTASASIDVMAQIAIRAQVESLIQQILNGKEGQFIIKVMQEGRLFFEGPITMDSTDIEIRGDTFIFKVTATDGLAMIKDKEYRKPNDEPFDGYTESTFVKHIAHCIQLLPHADLITGPAFIINPAFWEKNHPGTGVCPLEYSRVHHSIFTRKDKQGKYSYSTVWDVLMNTCIAHDLQVYYAFGAYYFECLSKRAGEDQDYFIYDKNGNNIGAFVDTLGLNAHINKHDIVMAMGAKQRLIAPFREVAIKYNFDKDIGLSTSFRWDYLSLGEKDAGDNLLESEKTAIAFSFQLQYSMDFVKDLIADPKDYRRFFNVFWKFRLILTNQNGVQGTWTIPFIPGPPPHINSARIWSADISNSYHLNAHYTWTPPQNDDDPAERFITTGLLTLDVNDTTLPLSGDQPGGIFGFAKDDIINIKVDFQLLNIYNDEGNIFSYGGYFFKWWVENFKLNIVEGGNNTTLKKAFDYLAANDVNNSKSIKLETKIGDGPGGGIGRIQVSEDLSEWVDSSDWGYNAAGGGGKLLKLVAGNIAARGKNTIEVLSATTIELTDFNVPLSPRHTVSWAGGRYMFMTGSKNLRPDESTVEFYKVSGLSTSSPGAAQETIIHKEIEVPNMGPHQPPPPPHKQLRAPAELDEVLYTGDIRDEIVIVETNYRVFNKGDIITLINPVSGAEDVLIVREDTKLGDTTLKIETHTFENSYLPGDKIRIVEEFDESFKYSETRELFLIYTTVTGNYIDLTADMNGQYLPGLLQEIVQDATVQEIHKRIRVYLRGQMLIWNQLGLSFTKPNIQKWGYNLNPGSDRIDLAWPADDDIFTVIIHKIERHNA